MHAVLGIEMWLGKRIPRFDLIFDSSVMRSKLSKGGGKQNCSTKQDEQRFLVASVEAERDGPHYTRPQVLSVTVSNMLLLFH